MTVQELGQDLQFVSDSQDVAGINGDFALDRRNGEGFDSYFISTSDGDYVEVWGMYGIVPFNNRSVYRVK